MGQALERPWRHTSVFLPPSPLPGPVERLIVIRNERMRTMAALYTLSRKTFFTSSRETDERHGMLAPMQAELSAHLAAQSTRRPCCPDVDCALGGLGCGPGQPSQLCFSGARSWALRLGHGLSSLVPCLGPPGPGSLDSVWDAWRGGHVASQSRALVGAGPSSAEI